MYIATRLVSLLSVTLAVLVAAPVADLGQPVWAAECKTRQGVAYPCRAPVVPTICPGGVLVMPPAHCPVATQPAAPAEVQRCWDGGPVISAELSAQGTQAVQKYCQGAAAGNNM